MEESVYLEMADLQSKHWWYRGRRHIVSTVIRQFGFTRPIDILEAGCGPGGNLAMLKAFGRVCAFDPHEGARDAANAKGVATVIGGALPSDIPFDQLFDLVCAFDVIEHVEDDVSSLRALGARLAPGGRVLLTVPAHPWLWSQHDNRNHHYRRYTREALTKVIEDAGLRVEKVSAFNTKLFPLICGIRLAQNFLKLGSRAEEIMPSPRINAIFEKVFSSEASRVSHAGYANGISLLAVASMRSS